ncbi:39S ribosomal protein L37, mitochondrial [Anthophora retusa]
MKFTQALYKIHIGKATRYLWQHQRERRIPVTKAEEILASMNIPVEDAVEVVSQKPKHASKVIIESTLPSGVHPDWKDKSCLMFEDNNVLQEGTSQACLLTKTVKIEDELPKKIKDLITDIPCAINNLLRRCVYTSVIYDAQQIKLPKLKDPNRPAWVFPRVYGISTTRKMHNLTKKFLQLCESLNGLDIAQYRTILHNELSSICIDKETDLLNFSLKMDIMMTSSVPLTPIIDANIDNEFVMPNIHPLHPTVGLTKSNIYKNEDLYSIGTETPFTNVHTIFINYDPEEVKNLTELPVTEDQIHARSMVKSFTIAAICARQRFGLDIKKLPEPVVVQCVQSDGQKFHFSVYQLNTLDLDGEKGIRNFWWSEPSIKLYESAQYENGQPCLEGYNNEIFKKFLAFYNNR